MKNVIFLMCLILFAATPTFAQTKSALELETNPFGDPWSQKSAPSTDIPVAFATCNTGGLRTGRNGLAEEEIQFISKTNFPFVIFDQCPPLNKTTTIYRDISDSLKLTNPNLKVFGYYALTKDTYQGNPDLKEDWYVHRKDMPKTFEYRLKHAEQTWIMDVTNTEYQDYISQYISDTLTSLHLDGFLDDYSGFPYPPCECANFDPIPDDIYTNWKSGMATLFAKVKQQIGPSKYHIYNAFQVYHPYLHDLEYTNQLLQYADGVYLEDAAAVADYAFPAKGQEYQTFLQVLQLGKTLNKLVFFVVNTGNAYPFQTTTEEQQRMLSRHYLAFYLNFFQGSLTPLIYYFPISTGNAWLSEAYFAIWDKHIGQPLDETVETATGVYKRKFTNAKVIWNSNDKTGSFLNISDLNEDGSVDVFDLNLLITDYSNSGQLVTDIDGNGKVNMLDAGVILANFGKSL